MIVRPFPLILVCAVVFAGCGSSFDPNQPVNELSDVERADLCNRIIEPLRDPEFIDDAFTLRGIRRHERPGDVPGGLC